MIQIGLLSDTHGYLDPKIFEFFSECGEIWHAGDIGSVELSDRLAEFKPLRAVFGNIDGAVLRRIHPLHQRFSLEGLDIWITHIGGRPGYYDRSVQQELKSNPPDIFICGHSHILRVMRDPGLNNMLFLNPGAAGVHGLHPVRTLLRFGLHEGKALNMEAIELGPRATGVNLKHQLS